MSEERDRPEDHPGTGGAIHAEFLELCALSTSGNLTEEEKSKLEEHLAVCAECWQAAKEFEQVIDHAIPAAAEELAPELASEALKRDSSFDQAAAEASFLKRLSEEKQRAHPESSELDGWLSPLVVRRSRAFRRNIGLHLWLPLAAAVVLSATLGILTYRMGKHRGVDATRAALGDILRRDPHSEEALAAAIRERDAANGRLSEQDNLLGSLKREMARQAGENSKLKALQADLEAQLESSTGKEGQLSAERDRLAEEIASSQTALQVSEGKLQELEKERNQSSVFAANLQAQVAALSRTVTEQQNDIDRETELLSKDKDIRDLMGARNLFVTEVYDVEQSGETQKAFGRLFYTKGKSLVFYAYDVDKKPEWKNVNSIQAWGMRGPDQQEAVNLGMFYEDNLGKKRWVLKFNDQKTLSQIDAVFVTLEPHGGSVKPSRKPFMFAYLKMEPNHP
jgi:hypothetical protein